MMLLAPLLILISVGGSYTLDFSCYRVKIDECEELLLHFEIPENAQDLLQRCQDFQGFGSCVANAQESCDDAEEAARTRKGVSFLSSTCEEDNPTFKVISNNLQCVMDSFKASEGSCWVSLSEKNRERIKEQLEALEESSVKVRPCVYHLMEATCQGRIYGRNCGTEVKDAIEEIYLGALAAKETCTLEVLEVLEPFGEVYLEILEEEFGPQNDLDKKRK